MANKRAVLNVMSQMNRVIRISRAGNRGYLIIFGVVAGLLFCSGVLNAYLISHQVSIQYSATTSVATPHNTSKQLLLMLTPVVLFSDDFENNSHNWEEGKGSGFSSVIKNGSLTMTETNHRLFREPLPLKTVYRDFTITTTFTIIKGDQYDSAGLYLRTTDATNQGYYFDIFGNNEFDIAKIASDASNSSSAMYLVTPTFSAYIHSPGQKNTMTVNMKGSTIELFINSTLIQTVHDSEFASGGITLYVDNGRTSNGVTVSFDRVQVDNAPTILP